MQRPPLVLVADDHEWSARSFESILGPEGYAVLRAYTGRQTLDLARSAQPDALILDLQLPDMTGIEVCRRLRGEAIIAASTPVTITSSGPVGRAERLDAVDAGAWELLVQPVDADLFLRKLRNFVAARREVESLQDASLLDHLTGLYNARGLARRARELGADAVRRRGPLACVALAPDTDESALDEQFVEQLAARIAEYLGDFFRQYGRVSDAIGRLGQTEFAIIAPATEAEGAMRMVERIEQSIAARPLTIDGKARPVRLRAGYATVADLAESPVDPVELLLKATAALRHERRSGEHRVPMDPSQLPH